jgi:hypothetical protein
VLSNGIGSIGAIPKIPGPYAPYGSGALVDYEWRKA